MARRRSNSGAGAKVLGGLLVLGLFLLILKWLLITVAILIIPFGAWWFWDWSQRAKEGRVVSQQHMEATRRRQEVESLAVVDAGGGCGWCGSRLAHYARSGQLLSPSEFHRDAIEESVSGTSGAAASVAPSPFSRQPSAPPAPAQTSAGWLVMPSTASSSSRADVADRTVTAPSARNRDAKPTRGLRRPDGSSP